MAPKVKKTADKPKQRLKKPHEEGSDSDDEHDQQHKKRRSKTAEETKPTTSKHQTQSTRKESSDYDSGMKKEPTFPDKDKESSSSTTDEANTENVKYVYRLLRPGEPFSDGIYPKDISSKKSILEHVLHGSHYSHETKFISCCKTMKGIKSIYENHRLDYHDRDIVKINVQKLNLEEVNVIDLTTSTGIQHLESSFKAQDYARMYEEIILEPTNCIPGDCIEKVATVRNHQIFYETP